MHNWSVGLATSECYWGQKHKGFREWLALIQTMQSSLAIWGRFFLKKRKKKIYKILLRTSYFINACCVASWSLSGTGPARTQMCISLVDLAHVMLCRDVSPWGDFCLGLLPFYSGQIPVWWHQGQWDGRLHTGGPTSLCGFASGRRSLPTRKGHRSHTRTRLSLSKHVRYR